MTQNTIAQSYNRLLLAVLLALALLAVLFLWSAAQSVEAIPAAKTQETWIPHASSAIQAPYPITCALVITTTDILTPHQSFTTALPLTNYQNLALVSGTQWLQVQAHDDYFVANPKPGTFYQMEAIPTLPGNYNLGMVVYDYNYQPTFTDADVGDGPTAHLRWMVGTAVPYYIVVWQIATVCSGGYYNLIVHESGYWTYLPVLVKHS